MHLMMATNVEIAERAARWFGAVEIHCSAAADFPVSLRKAIKRVGGEYSAARGDAIKRYVDKIPSTEVGLIDKICSALHAHTIIARSPTREALCAASDLDSIKRGHSVTNSLPTTVIVCRLPKRFVSMADLLAQVEAYCLPRVGCARAVEAALAEQAQREAERAAELRRKTMIAEAAPDMLAALRLTRDYLRMGPIDKGSEAFDAIDAAIRKAEGRS